VALSAAPPCAKAMEAVIHSIQEAGRFKAGRN
jgi:hypothetical protein